MTKTQATDDPHAPEVEEIIGRQPGSLVRWGVTAIFFVILSVLLISWFIKYPDLITAKVVITTNPPPVTLVSRHSGVLYLLKEDNSAVQNGDILAYIQSNTSIDALLYLEERLKKNENLLSITLPGSLGDLQPHFASLISALTSLSLIKENRINEKQIDQLRRQIITYQKLGGSLVKQQKLSAQELKLAHEKFFTDSILFVQKVTAAIDFNQDKASWLQQQRNARNAEASLLNNEAQINQIEKQISDLEMQQHEQRQKLELAVHNAKDQFLAQVSKHKELYLFIATSVGNLSYLGFLENEQFIEINKPVLSVVPQQRKLIARAELPIRGSGKVKEGQLVNIRLENYPFEQFGMLKGKISSISIMPGEDKYWVAIELPNQLQTSLKKTLVFKQQMTGNTEIITEDLRLLERLFYQFRRLLKAR
jgi:HlyD family secretion protein